MSYIPYYVDPNLSHAGISHCIDGQPLSESLRPEDARDCARFEPRLFHTSVPLQPILLDTHWINPTQPTWEPQPDMGPSWGSLQHSLANTPLSETSCDPATYMSMLGYETSPDYEAYSPPSTTASEMELPPPFDTISSGTSHSLPAAPIVPSSSRETPLVRARLRVRRPSKESSKQAMGDERKYTCDFCPVQMSRLHDINRHIRIHTGVHPYACIGCGETFRRTDARTRHWCKSPECFKTHSTQAPASKTRKRIPTL